MKYDTKSLNRDEMAGDEHLISNDQRFNDVEIFSAGNVRSKEIWAIQRFKIC